MKKLLIIITLTVVLAISFQLSAFSDVPHLIGYQGRLTDADGNPREGSFKITFRIYDAEAAGNLLWEEIHPNATVTGGIFDILLGSVTALDLPFDKQYYLAIQVGSDPEMTPRQQIASVGYSLRSKVADTIEDPTLLVPQGAIIMWSGLISDIPEGWALCDGTNGTPDLRDKFIVGAMQDEGGVSKTNITGSLTQSGGDIEHYHSGSTSVGIACGGSGAGQGGESTHYHTFSTNVKQHVPPYYALAYIMKL